MIYGGRMETDWLSSIIESIISSLKIFQRNFQTLSMVGFAAVLIATWEVRISNRFVFPRPYIRDFQQ